MRAGRSHRNFRNVVIAACSLAFWAGVLPWASAPGVPAQLIQQAAPKSLPVLGRPAPGFDLKTLDGEAVNLEILRGKPVIINFFATWCDPCREEMPLINELALKGGARGYNVLGIAVEDTRAAVTAYAAEAKLAFPIALDLNNTVKRAYRIFGPPATFFIDAQGVIRDVVLGPITLPRVRDALRKAGAAA